LRDGGKQLEKDLERRDQELRKRTEDLERKGREADKFAKALEAKSAEADRLPSGVDRRELTEVIRRVHKAVDVADQLIGKLELVCRDVVDGRRAAGMNDVRDVSSRMRKALELAAGLLKPYA